MLNDMERHQIAREIWLHIQLNHPSIIALYAAWKDRDYIYLVLEWAPEVRRACQHSLQCIARPGA
jgi:aurora kinase